VFQNGPEAVEDGLVVHGLSVEVVIAAVVGTAHGLLQAVGNLTGLVDGVLGRLDEGPLIGGVVDLKVVGTFGGGYRHLIRRPDRHGDDTAEQQKSAEQRYEPSAPRGMSSCHKSPP